MSQTETPTTTPSAVVELIDRALAKEYLARNVKNRTINQGTARSYGAAMQAGEWKLTGDSIKFDLLGNLIDGQHRLTGIIISGETVAILVVRGLPPEAQYVIDTGKKRSAGDALRLSAIVDKHEAIIAAAARTAILVDEGKHEYVRHFVNGLRPVRNDEVMHYVERNPDIIDAAAFAASVRSRIKQVPPSTICYVFMVLARLDHAAAVSLFTDLADRRSSGNSDPITYVLRAYEHFKTSAAPRISGHMFILYTAWNARRMGKSISRRISTEPKTVNGEQVYPRVPTPHR
jgi:hypothetical protein